MNNISSVIATVATTSVAQPLVPSSRDQADGSLEKDTSRDHSLATGSLATQLKKNGEIEENDAVTGAAIVEDLSAGVRSSYATVHQDAGINQRPKESSRRALPEEQEITGKPSRELDQQGRLQRLEAAMEYLLINALNVQAPELTGEASNHTLVAFFFKLLLELRPAYFLDIGANDGSTALRVKETHPYCEVWAFEANPQIFERVLPALQGRGVNYVNVAMVATSGVVNIYAPRTLSRAIINGEILNSPIVEPIDTGKTSILKRTENATYKEFSVQGLALDDFMAIRGLTSLVRDTALWIDVEGAAHEVLAGGRIALGKVSIIIIESENFEFWAGQKQCADIAKLIIAEGFIPVRRDREYGDQQFNTVFIHNSFLHLLYPDAYRLNRSPSLTKHAEAPIAVPPKAALRRTYRSIEAQAASEMPIFVPAFNNPTYVRKMHGQLADLGLHNVYIVDNGSTNPEMLKLLKEVEKDAKVIRVGANNGPRETVFSALNSECIPDIFCVTDPDLELNPNMPEDSLAQLADLTRKYKLGKAGLALRLDDSHLMHNRKFRIIGREWHVTEWERQFWEEPMDPLRDGSPVYRAILDTTFAVYNKKFFTPNSFYLAARVAGDYTCRHLPWYRDSGMSAQEEEFYRQTQKYSLHIGGVVDVTPSGKVSSINGDCFAE